LGALTAGLSVLLGSGSGGRALAPKRDRCFFLIIDPPLARIDARSQSSIAACATDIEISLS
jgi:hypothetical protein